MARIKDTGDDIREEAIDRKEWLKRRKDFLRDEAEEIFDREFVHHLIRVSIEEFVREATRQGTRKAFRTMDKGGHYMKGRTRDLAHEMKDRYHNKEGKYDKIKNTLLDELERSLERLR